MASVCGRFLINGLRSLLRSTPAPANYRFKSIQAVKAGKAKRQIGRLRRNVEKWKKENEDSEMKLRMYSFDVESLATRGFLRSTKAYTPPPDVYARLDQIASDTIPTASTISNLEDVSLKDPTLKYKFLVACIKEFQHDVPSSQLHKIQTIGDAREYFMQSVKTTTSYDDLAKSNDLPPNLHVQPEPHRFNPETDSLFGGISAFPGRSTVITGLKAKRLFKGHKEPTIIRKLKMK